MTIPYIALFFSNYHSLSSEKLGCCKDIWETSLMCSLWEGTSKHWVAFTKKTWTWKDIHFLTKCDAVEKAQKLDEVGRKGDFHRYMKILWKGGEFVWWRRPSVDMIVQHKDYLACEHWFVLWIRKELWRHQKKCPLKKQAEDNANIATLSVVNFKLIW